MANSQLESRVTELENQVSKILDALSQPTDPAKRVTDLDRVTGFFGDDPVIKRVFREAEKYRENDRKKARGKSL